MTIVKVIFKNNKWITPWGHEFNTRSELDAFILGMKYISGCLKTHSEYLLEKVDFSKEDTENEN
jgi:hypothetical protein